MTIRDDVMTLCQEVGLEVHYPESENPVVYGPLDSIAILLEMALSVTESAGADFDENHTFCAPASKVVDENQAV